MYRLTETYQSHIVVLTIVFSILLIPMQSAFASEDSLSFEQLIGELENPDSNRCWDAINALGATGDKRAVLPLMAALEEDMKQHKGIAMAIIPALGHLSDERAFPLLIKALNKLKNIVLQKNKNSAEFMELVEIIHGPFSIYREKDKCLIPRNT